ncbi:MAG: glycosyltransferase 87 family protein [Actinomycetota bacterium]|nr:glycosyltransferase 87 family protein [Actinomycetota bacterium]
MPSELISEPTPGEPTSGIAGGRLLVAGSVAAGMAGVALSYRIASGGPVVEQGWSVLAVLALWWVAFGVGATLVLRLPVRTALVAVLVLGVVMRIVALAGSPVMSDDLYRYAWDARVQAAGVNPYKYPPAAPELAYLHEPWLWPDAAGCAELDREPGCTRTNRDRSPTIYPPLGQAWFWVVDAVLPSDARERGWQAAAGLLDVALLGVLVLALRSFGRDPRYVVLYAWSPIAVLETAQNAHVDGLAVLGIVGALWAAHRGRNGLAGGLLAAATLVKLYPALLLPILLRKHPIRVLAAFATLGVAAYTPHVIALGPKVIGFLPGYLAEERYDTGGRFLLLGLTGLSGSAVKVVAVMIMAVGVWAAWAVARDGDVRARCLLGGALLLITPVQPWYALALVAIAALGGAWWWLAVAVAGYPIYLDALLGDGRPEAIGRLSYGLAALAVATLSWRMRSSRSSGPPRIDLPPSRSEDERDGKGSTALGGSSAFVLADAR